MRVLAEALRRAGWSEPAAIAAALEGLHDADVGGFFVSFAPGRARGSNFVEVRLRPRGNAPLQ